MAQSFEPTLGDVLQRIEVFDARMSGEVRELRARVEQLESRQASQGSTADATALVMAIAAATRGRVFNCRELLAHAGVDEALRTAVHGLTARRLGKQLRRLAERPHGGLMIAYVARDAHGRMWAVVPVADALA